MVDVQRDRVRVVPAVDASVGDLVLREPLLDGPNSLVGRRVLRLSVPLAVQASLAPSAPLLRGRRRSGRPGSLTAQVGALPCVAPTSSERAVAHLAGQFVGGHTIMVPADIRYPCKPDIFEATYEPADDAT